MPVKTTLYYVMQRAGSLPISLVVGEEQFVILVYTNAGGRTQTCSVRLEFPVGGYLEAPIPIYRSASHFAFRVLVTGGPYPGDVPRFASRPTWPGEGGV